MGRFFRFLLGQLGDFLLGIALTLLLFLFVEGGLRIAGYGDSAAIPPPRHLTAGFDPSTHIFEPDPEHPGGWRSTYSHDRSGEIVVPPRTSTRRVLLFGGSNTAGFPERVLEQALTAQGPQEYEVVNLGRAGYGSGRVAILFREALELLDPDLVIVYSGHNEFVEKSFAMDLEQAWSNPLIAKLAEWLERSLTGRLLRQWVQEREPSVAEYTRLQDWEAEYKKFADLPWEGTEKVWDAYEENLDYMADLAEQRGVPMLLCTPVWNRLSPPRVAVAPKELDDQEIELAERQHRRAKKLYPEPFRALLPQHDKDRVHIFDWGGPRRRLLEGRVQDPLPGLLPSSGWLSGRDPEFPMNQEWEPKVRAWYENLAWLRSPRSPAEEESLTRAVRLLGEALQHRPDDAHLHYELALARYALGERKLASEFAEAASLDHAPRKAVPLSNERVRRVAARHGGVQLFDSDRRFAEACPEGLVGWEWMVDHCHISHGAARALLEDMADEVLALLKEKQ